MLTATDIGPGCPTCYSSKGSGIWGFSLTSDTSATDDGRFTVEAKCALCGFKVRFLAPAGECDSAQHMRERLTARLSEPPFAFVFSNRRS